LFYNPLLEKVLIMISVEVFTMRNSFTLLSKKVFTALTGLLITLGLIATLSSCKKKPENGTTNLPSDASVTKTIKDELSSTTDVPEKHITVSTSDGIVTLSGSISNLLAKKKAAEICENTDGVLSVVNNLKVTTDRPDEAIQNDIDRMLSTDPATENWEISSTVNNGLVTLKGAVDSWQERKLAETIVSGVKGVKEVTNNLQISYSGNRSDSEIKAEVKNMLEYDARIKDNRIKVTVDEDTVKLSGSVGSAPEKRLAVQKAHVTGVAGVKADQLEVHPEFKENSFHNVDLSTLSPTNIQTAIKRAWSYDPRVPAGKLNVKVGENIAVLDGDVLNLNSKLAAEEDARNTTGIEKVVDNINVKRKVVVSPKIPTTDKAIKKRINNAIIRDPYVDTVDVKVKVAQGIVQLDGSVENDFKKQQIQRIATDVKGIIAIDNNLKVTGTN